MRYLRINYFFRVILDKINNKIFKLLKIKILKGDE
jgi:hypothetical protein